MQEERYGAQFAFRLFHENAGKVGTGVPSGKTVGYGVAGGANDTREICAVAALEHEQPEGIIYNPLRRNGTTGQAQLRSRRSERAGKTVDNSLPVRLRADEHANHVRQRDPAIVRNAGVFRCRVAQAGNRPHGAARLVDG